MHVKLSRISQLQVKTNMEKHKVIQEQRTTHIFQSDWNLGKDGKIKKVTIYNSVKVLCSLCSSSKKNQIVGNTYNVI